MMQLRYYQAEALDALYNYFLTHPNGNPLIALPTGCHGLGTKILMFNGSVKAVEHVEIGDLLMGPDSKPRKVLSLARGRENMAKIIPNKGDSFIVNMGHILSLKTTQEKASPKHNSELIKGDIYNLSVADYMEQSKWFKHTRKLWRAAINFSTQPWLPLTPYFMGIFLGDGSFSHKSVSITSMDDEILESFAYEVNWHGCDINKYKKLNNKASTWTIKNKIRSWDGKGTKIHQILTNLNLNQKTSSNKFIPSAYKTASRDDRLCLLAGLIDTDGSLNSNGYDFISKSKQLADDVVFVSRSLGFSCEVKPCKKSDQNNIEGTYYRVYISGDLSIVPVKLKRKEASVRKQKKDVLVTGFKLEILPEDDYYGFELDSDHLYLTADFTVHHNTGKSVLPAAFINGIMRQWPRQRFGMITHVKELIQQNAEELLKLWPEAPLGIHSAGLKQRDYAHSIIYGGVQSMVKKADWFGHRDIIFIDEAHLLSGDSESSYHSLLSMMKLLNPNLKIVGMTATKYRMGMGLLTNNGIFTDIIYDKTDYEGFNELLDAGFMSKLIPQRTRTEFDVSDVGVQNGDFVATQLQGAVDKAEITYEMLKETVHFGQDRRCWLIFASGVAHAEHIAEQLGAFGIDCAPVHSKRPAEYNDAAIKAFKNFELRAIVNYGKLTTGFNHPWIDLIVMGRATLSVPLWVQMLGRGTRPAQWLADVPGSFNKTDCKVLDFARNTPRLGCINDPKIPTMKKGGAGEMPVKLCEYCGAYNHISARLCCQCDEPFTFQQKIISKAGTDELIKSAATEPTPIIETIKVLNAIYTKHMGKNGKPPTIKVMYFTTGLAYTEYVCLEHSGMAGKMARDWWRKRHKIEPPNTVDAALHYVAELKCPRFIRVHVNKRYAEILGVEF